MFYYFFNIANIKPAILPKASEFVKIDGLLSDSPSVTLAPVYGALSIVKAHISGFGKS